MDMHDAGTPALPDSIVDCEIALRNAELRAGELKRHLDKLRTDALGVAIGDLVEHVKLGKCRVAGIKFLAGSASLAVNPPKKGGGFTKTKRWLHWPSEWRKV